MYFPSTINRSRAQSVGELRQDCGLGMRFCDIVQRLFLLLHAHCHIGWWGRTGRRAACWERGFGSPTSASRRQQPSNAPTTLGSPRPERRSTSPPVVNPDLRHKTCGDPLVDTVEGPRKTLVQPAGASAGYATPPGSTRLVAFCFPPSRSSCEPTPSTPTGGNLCSLATLPPRQKANWRKYRRLTSDRGSVFWLRNWHIAAYPLTISFYVVNQSGTLRPAELIGTMVFERAAPVGFAGRVARREFGVDSCL
jgi:hypothetical protein